MYSQIVDSDSVCSEVEDLNVFSEVGILAGFAQRWGFWQFCSEVGNLTVCAQRWGF